MINKNFKFFALILSIIFFIASCNKDNNLKNSEDELFQISTKTIIGSTNEGLKLYEINSDYAAIISTTIINNLKTSFEIKELVDFKIEEPSENEKRHQYIYVTIIDIDGNELPTAIQLKKKINPQEKLKGYASFEYIISHTCSGNPCTCCAFITDSNNNIIGCDCIEGGINSPCYIAPTTGFCNHTIGTNAK